jgi:hypothetical protein
LCKYQLHNFVDSCKLTQLLPSSWFYCFSAEWSWMIMYTLEGREAKLNWGPISSVDNGFAMCMWEGKSLWNVFIKTMSQTLMASVMQHCNTVFIVFIKWSILLIYSGLLSITTGGHSCDISMIHVYVQCMWHMHRGMF